jgi:choline kinase
MKTIILAAGMGTRMGELTKVIPKCLLEVNGKTVIETQIDILNESGIEDITVVVGYRADDVRKVLGSRVTYVENEIYSESNSSYSLYLARELLSHGWLHMNCDLLFSRKILTEVLKPENNNSVVIDLDIKPSDDQEKVCIEDDVIIKMSKTMPFEEVDGKTIGMARFSAEGARVVLNHLSNLVDSGEKNRWFFSIISDVLEKINFSCASTDGAFWAELDTPEDLANARKKIMLD